MGPLGCCLTTHTADDRRVLWAAASLPIWLKEDEPLGLLPQRTVVALSWQTVMLFKPPHLVPQAASAVTCATLWALLRRPGRVALSWRAVMRPPCALSWRGVWQRVWTSGSCLVTPGVCIHTSVSPHFVPVSTPCVDEWLMSGNPWCVHPQLCIPTFA